MITLIAAVTLTTANAGKVLAIIGLVYTCLQGLKKAFPAISGWWSVALNVALSVLMVIVALPPDQLWSLSTLTTLLTAGIAALGAAGVHGTVQNLGPSSTTPTTTAKGV